MMSQAAEKIPKKIDLKIRDASRDDLEILVDLLKALFAMETDFVVDKVRQRRGLEMMLDGCGKHRCVKVAQADGGVVGMCTAQVLISTAEGGKVALVEDMVVDARYRGMGIGRQLVTAMEVWARQRGLTRLQLLAERTNFSALDFYDKMGWRPTRLICLRRRWKQEQK